MLTLLNTYFSIFYIKTQLHSLYYTILSFNLENKTLFLCSFKSLMMETFLYLLKGIIYKTETHKCNQQFMNKTNTSLIRYIFIIKFMYEGNNLIGTHRIEKYCLLQQKLSANLAINIMLWILLLQVFLLWSAFSLYLIVSLEDRWL